jgi:hypothetical protein
VGLQATDRIDYAEAALSAELSTMEMKRSSMALS